MGRNEIVYFKNCLSIGKFSGDGKFTSRCSELIELHTSCTRALLTHSCTSALEMSAILLEIEPGDEIILPSYTFVSTVNAFVLRGAVPVFVDIRPDTLNIDENLIEAAISSKTKAIIVVHYAGVACEMNRIMEIAKKENILVIEDAAQAILAKYNGKPLGSFGTFGTFSFHETKNIHCGEGGAILINDAKYIERAEIIREKGTNRSQFFRGQVDKYRWVDIGSSYLPSEQSASFLAAQLEDVEFITKSRLDIWNNYHDIFLDLEKTERVKRPTIPRECQHNGHLYYLLLNKRYDRDNVLYQMNQLNINAVFHYQPLHSAPAGKKYSKCPLHLPVTEDNSKRLIRLPLWIGFDQYQRIYETIKRILK